MNTKGITENIELYFPLIIEANESRRFLSLFLISTQS
jgi:hypothetical protein